MKRVAYEVFMSYKIPIIISIGSEVIILFFFSRLSVYFFPQSRAVNLNMWDLWNVWDAPHYIYLASSGYQRFGEEALFINFLPFFPLLIFIFKFFFQTSYLIAGFLVSFISSVLLAVMLYKITLLDYSKKTSVLAVLMLFIFPTSFFLHIPYTESVFMLISITAFYLARKKRHLLSFIFVAMATSTKIVGLALIPAIFAEIFVSDRPYFNKRNIFIGSAISLSGFLIYLLLNYFLWDNFFYFTIVQKQNWFETFAPLGQGMVAAFKSLSWRTGLEKIMLGYGQLVAFFLALMLSLYALIKVRISYGIFSLIVLWISFSMSFWVCMPRYILSIFPMFIALALFSKNALFKYSWIVLSSALLMILSLIFLQYGPVL